MRSNRLEKIQNKVTGLKACPACGSKNLIHIDCDVICDSCSWNSAAMSVEAGELDDLIYEYEGLSAEINQRAITQAKTPPYESIQQVKKTLGAAS